MCFYILVVYEVKKGFANSMNAGVKERYYKEPRVHPYFEGDIRTGHAEANSEDAKATHRH